VNIYSGILTAGATRVVRNDGLAANIEKNSFAATSNYGEFLAYWSGECFRLVDLNDNVIWTEWINGDKASPTGIKFSRNGYALACFFHFEGVPGMFFCDIEKGTSTMFPCGRPIGHDEDLCYFTVSHYDPYEYDKYPLFEAKLGSEDAVKIPSEVASEILKNGPVIVDRNKRIVAQPLSLKENWDGLAIQKDLSGFVVRRDRSIIWFKSGSEKPDVTFKDCIPEKEYFGSYKTILSLSEDNVLLQSGENSLVVNRNRGLIWQGDKMASILLKGNRILAIYQNSTLSVIREDGTEELRIPKGTEGKGYVAEIIDGFRFFADNKSITTNYKVYAADIIDDSLYLADSISEIQMIKLLG
jgi:hypothetical protein